MSDAIPPIYITREIVDGALATVAPHWRPILLGVRDDGLALAGVYQDRKPFRISNGRPTVLLLGDDVRESFGPDAFHPKSLRRFVQRCAAAVVVACAAEARFYAMAVASAAATRKDVVLVETRPEHEADWIDRLREIKPGLPLLVGTVRPPSDARH